MRKFFLLLLANAVNSAHDQGECCLSAVFFALLTCWHVQFSKIFACLPFFLRKWICIYRQNWYCEEIPSSQNSDKAASLILLCSGKHCFKCIKKSGTVNHLTINQAVETPWSLFFPSESSTLGCSCIGKKFLLWNFGKTTSLQQRFCFALYSPPRCDSLWYWSNQIAWITKSN